MSVSGLSISLAFCFFCGFCFVCVGRGASSVWHGLKPQPERLGNFFPPFGTFLPLFGFS